MIKRILFILVLCLLILSPIVTAETLTGTVGDSVWNSTNYALNGLGALSDKTNGMFFKDIEKSNGFVNLVQFFVLGDGYLLTFDAGTPSSGTTTFTAYEATSQSNRTPLNSRVLGTGTIGFYRAYNGAIPPVETSQYMYVIIDNNWNITGLTGDKWINLTYNRTLLGNPHAYGYSSTPVPSGFAALTCGVATAFPMGTGSSGSKFTTYNKDATAYAHYSATKPSGLGIAGTIYKDNGGSTKYSSRVFISDANKKTITSELLTNVNDYNFTTNASQIYISILTPVDTFYNSSLLFSSGVPTTIPTPTQTPGGGPGTESNITIAVKGISNDSAIADAYVEMQMYKKTANHNDPNGWTSSLQGYTAGTTGYFQADGVDIGTYDIKVVVQKAGYQTSSEWITPSPYYYARIIWLYLDTTGQGGVPATINMTLQVKNSATGVNVANALVTVQDSIAGTGIRSVLTNATGYAVFKTFPNTANIGGTITATNYQQRSWSLELDPETGSYLQSKDYAKTLYIAPIGVPTGTQTPFPTPTPTPVAVDLLSLTATPDSINLGQTVTLTGSSVNATKLTYAGGLRRTLFYVNKHVQQFPFDFNIIGMYENVNATYWKFRPNYGADWGTPSTASPLTMTNVPDVGGTYTYSFHAYDSSGKAISQAATDVVLVGGGAAGGALTMELSAQDGKTGAHLSNYQMNITDDNSGVVTEFGNISYDKDASLQRGNSYTLRASKENYISNSQTFVVPVDPRIVEGDFGAIAVVQLFPSGYISAGNTSVIVYVNDAETYYPIAGVQVSIPGQTTQFTDEGGNTDFTIAQNTAYTVTASKTGYCKVSESKNTTTQDYQYVRMYMKYGACTGTTPTPTPTDTPIVTMTTPPWMNGTATACEPLPDGATFLDVIKHNLACNGFKDTASQNMALSMLIMLFCGLILGRVAKGVGVLAGVIAGAAVSVAMGFLPLWVIIIIIILAGLVFAGKVFWSQGS